jgi:two-component system OmpR family sensor kinase
MFFKSLRWRLQAWHAAILLIAVAGFGAALYFEISKAKFDEIDGELLVVAHTMEGVLHAVPPQVLQGGFQRPPGGRGGPPDDGPPRGNPPDEMGRDDPGPGQPRENGGFDEGRRPPPRGNGDEPPPPREGRPFQKGGPGRPEGRGRDPSRRPEGGPEGRPEGAEPNPDGRPERDRGPDGPNPGERMGRPPPPRRMSPDDLEKLLVLPHSFVERFTNPHGSPYFIVWAENGAVLKSQSMPIELPPPIALPLRPGMDYRAWQRGAFREVMIEGPEHSRVLIGRSIERETGQLRSLFWQLSFTGLGVFATGLVGGWWLSGRAVKPIEKMSETAASISAANLSRRIDTENVDSELAGLGRVLNATFDRLQAAFEQQIRFTADASHELRTPLSVVLTNTELALSRDRTADDYRETIQTCLRAARRMKRLVEDLMVLARADAGRLELRLMPVDLREIVDECISLVEPLAEQRRVDLAAHGAHIVVPGDGDRLAQVLTNLLSNAIQYNVEGGNVTVSITEDADAVSVKVADTGVGIGSADMPHIFERFYRVDRARSRHTGGSGLGLSICKTIIEAHGGQIEVARNEQGGTTVRFRLPRRSDTQLKSRATVMNEQLPIGGAVENRG